MLNVLSEVIWRAPHSYEIKQYIFPLVVSFPCYYLMYVRPLTHISVTQTHSLVQMENVHMTCVHGLICEVHACVI
jgi:hypothetical protein